MAVIELFVKPGDSIKVDDALVTLESDKATMDVPSSAAGVVRKSRRRRARVSEGACAAAGSRAADARPWPAAAPALRAARLRRRRRCRLPAAPMWTSWCRTSAATAMWP